MMLDVSHSLVHRCVAAQKRRTWWLLAMLAVTQTVGCRAVDYRAATLPEQYRVPMSASNEINLANVSGLGSGASLIGPGDLLEVTIASGGDKEKVDPLIARVAQNGNVKLPLIGEVPIAGIEPFEAAERIGVAAIQAGVYRQPAVVVKIEEPAVNRVTVLGAVVRPGVQKLPRTSSDVLSAVASAGGFSEDAGTQVEVMREHFAASRISAAKKDGVVTASYNGPSFSPPPMAGDSAFPGASPPGSLAPHTYRLDLAEADPNRKADYRVGDGDVVMVLPEKDRYVHVTGLVNNPSQVKIPRDQDLYVLDAIAMAGGLKFPVADKVYVIRRLEYMQEPVVIELSAAKAKKNGDENLRLAAGDLVSVESTMLTHTVDAITKFFHVTMGIGGTVTAF
jgi:polysaccharide export outer membrane protein